MDPWGASWKPAIGDDVESFRFGSGKIISVQDDRFEVEYDLMAYDVPSDGSPIPISSEPETGWHDRADLEPGRDTLARLIRERSTM